MVDVAIVNAWLIYRRYCTPLGFQLNKQKSLAEFTAEFAQSLIHAHRTQGDKSNKGRPKRKSYEPLKKTGNKKLFHNQIKKYIVIKLNIGHNQRVRKSVAEIVQISAEWNTRNATFTCV